MYKRQFAQFRFTSKVPYYYIGFIMMVGVYLIMKKIGRSKLGFALRTIREDEDAAAAIGINPTKYKVIAVVISAIIAGLVGFFYVSYIRYIDPDIMIQSKSTEIVLPAVVGGAAYIEGPLIGGLIMTHADDEGMAVPPRIAPYQVVLVPVIKNEADREKIMAYIEEVKASLKGLTPFGEKVRIKVDNRNKSSVDKFWEWTRKGAPVICEIGMRDAEGGKVMVKERLKLGTPEGKEIIAREEFARGLSERLENIQHEMFVRAKARLENNIRTDIVTHEEFEKYFANANRFIKDGDKNAVTFVRGKWSGDPNSEELLKALKITIRCIPFDQSGSKGECLLTGAKDATVDVIYARSY